MLSWLIRPARSAVALLVTHESNRQIAAGAALGVLLGLMPKGNLTFVVLLLLLSTLRVNRAAGLMAMGLITLLTPWIDPFLHTLGLRVLTLPSLQPYFAQLYDAPLGAWIGFDNSVAAGGLLVGVYALYPVYLLVKTVVERARPAAARWVLKHRIGRMLLGADLTTRLGLSA